MMIIIIAALAVVLIVVAIIVLLVVKRKKNQKDPAEKYKVEEIEVKENPSPKPESKAEAPPVTSLKQEKEANSKGEQLQDEENSRSIVEGDDLTRSAVGLVAANEAESAQKLKKEEASFHESQVDDEILESEEAPQVMLADPEVSARPKAKHDF